MIILEDILKIEGAQLQGAKLLKRQFKYVCIDSRKANKDEIFIALKGEKHDAHNFLPEVLKGETKLYMVHKDWYLANKQNYPKHSFLTVPDTTIALGRLAHYHKKRLKTKTIAIGGSNGKTTTKELIAAVLSKKFNVLFTAGNLNNHIGVPLTLLRLNEKHSFCVLEVGCNHFNEIKYLCEIAEPDYGIITNIGKEHLEFFKTKAGVAKAEFEMIDVMQKLKKKTIFFANYTDEYIKKKSLKLPTNDHVSYGLGIKSDFEARFMGYEKNFTPRIAVLNKKKSTEYNINTFGKHSVYNGLAAVAVGVTLGVPSKAIQSALLKFTSGSGKRMEVLNKNGLIVINDCYNSNPDSVILGLQTLSEYQTTRQKHVVFGDMLELGKVSAKEHEGIGKQITKLKLKNIYAFGAESKHTIQSIKGALHAKHYETHATLISDLKMNLKKGDVVYVKGSRGMKMETVTEALIA